MLTKPVLKSIIDVSIQRNYGAASVREIPDNLALLTELLPVI